MVRVRGVGCAVYVSGVDAAARAGAVMVVAFKVHSGATKLCQ